MKRYLTFNKDRACPLCFSIDQVLLSNKMQFGLDCTTVICKKCGFCFVSPSPQKEAYNNFYKEVYFAFYKKLYNSSFHDHITETDSDRERLNLIERFKKIKDSSVLEIGPGPGRFLHLTCLRGGKCSALEPSPDFKKILEEKRIKVIGGLLEDFIPDKKFDMIFMFHVLEHFYDPAQAFSKLKNMLSDDGIVVIEVPNIWKPYKSLDHYFLRYVHLSYFSPNTLSYLLESNGFKLLFTDYGTKKVLSHQPIFVIAQPRSIEDLNRKYFPLDNWKVLLHHLQLYRWKYRLLYAPIMNIAELKKLARKILSRSFLGEAYRNLKIRSKADY